MYNAKKPEDLIDLGPNLLAPCVKSSVKTSGGALCLCSQFLAALRAATRKNAVTPNGRASFAEAVAALADKLTWLICTFHRFNSDRSNLADCAAAEDAQADIQPQKNEEPAYKAASAVSQSNPKFADHEIDQPFTCRLLLLPLRSYLTLHAKRSRAA